LNYKTFVYNLAINRLTSKTVNHYLQSKFISKVIEFERKVFFLATEGRDDRRIKPFEFCHALGPSLRRIEKMSGRSL